MEHDHATAVDGRIRELRRLGLMVLSECFARDHRAIRQIRILYIDAVWKKSRCGCLETRAAAFGDATTKRPKFGLGKMQIILLGSLG